MSPADRRSAGEGANAGAAPSLRDIARAAPIPSADLRASGLLDTVPELRALADTPQDPRWHPEGDVLVHSLWTADLAATRCAAEGVAPDRREVLVLAALLHDVGKPDTTVRGPAGITSRGHAERGADIVRDLGRRMRWPQPVTTAVAALVETHMAHVSVRGEPSPRAARRLTDRLRAAGTSLADWAVVVDCDGRARGAAARPDASIPWRRVADRPS